MSEEDETSGQDFTDFPKKLLKKESKPNFLPIIGLYSG
jgi:hypothetical protein